MINNISKILKTEIESILGISPIQQRISLTDIQVTDEPTFVLKDILSCKLDNVAYRASFSRQSKSTQLVQFSKALIIVGGAFVLMSISNAVWKYNISSNSLQWIAASVVLVGFSIIILAAGLAISKREQSRVIRPLNSFSNDGFETEEMRLEFQRFLTWAKSHKLELSFELSENRFLKLPQTIWKSPDLPIVLFGNQNDHKNIFSADQYVLSSLVIAQSDWGGYLLFKNGIDYTNEQEVSKTIEKLQTDKEPVTISNEFQSLRQRARGKNTNWSPRTEMVCSDRKYLKRYMRLHVDINKIQTNRQSCHRILVFLEANFDDLDLIFEKKPTDITRQDVAQKLDKRLKSDLGIFGQTNISRYNQFKIKKWILLEKYLEETGIITDAELVKTYPSLKFYLDSKVTS